MIGIGIDTGGTYTDAVVYDMATKEVLSFGKALTTKGKLEIGIEKAIETLDEKYLVQAKMLALSTTLATNACVENKGGRAKLLMIGVDPKLMENAQEMYATYGFNDLQQLVVIDGKPEKIFKNAKDPDWGAFSRIIPEKFSDCESIGVVQVFAYANGGRFENEAREIIKEKLGLPVTLAHEMFAEVDVLKRGAGTLLNARLIPIIEEFLLAVKKVMSKKKLDVPVAIVRSDGSLMSEKVTRSNPVETLLSGPAASVIGGSVIAREDNAVIIDMGGTTTDIAIIKKGQPVVSEKGIAIGQWQTMVKGLYVDTFGLGGDSAVRFAKGELFLDIARVMPLSTLEEKYPKVVGQMKRELQSVSEHTRWLHEFYLLEKEVEELSRYSQNEIDIYKALKKGPLSIRELAAMTKQDVYTLTVGRLEEEGIIIRSGLTPTDMMIIKGDFAKQKSRAVELALGFMANNIKESKDEIPQAVYDLAIKKLYCNLARVLLLQKKPRQKKLITDDGISKMIEWSYEDACQGDADELFKGIIKTDMPLIGVGAPIHIFLPEVARLLGTKVIIPPQAAVANAIGAIAAQVIAKVQVKIVAEYEGVKFKGFSVFNKTKKSIFKEYDKAERVAVDLAKEQVITLAKERGISGETKIDINIEKLEQDIGASDLLFESKVQATMMGGFLV